MSLIKHTNKYTTVSNHIVHSKVLSWSAKGMYLYLNSKPDGWDFSTERIAKETSDTKYATAQVLKELVRFGLLERKAKQVKDEKNIMRFIGQEYHLYEEIKVTEEIPVCADFEQSGTQTVGNYDTQSNHETNKPLSLSKNNENFNLEEKKQEILANPLIPTLFNPITDLTIDEERKDKVIDRAAELCVVEMMNKKAHNNQLFGYMRNCIQQAIKELDSTTKTNTTIQKAEYYQAKKDNPKFKTNNQQPQKSAWVQPEKPQPKMYYEEI
jgi:hypothetical protein